jgi:putative transposase
MHEYRKLTPEQRLDLVRERLARGFPPHSPPHPSRGRHLYLLTAACYEHVCHMPDCARRRQLLDALFKHFLTGGVDLRAWVVLPNHYHLLAYVSQFSALSEIFRLVHGSTSRQWNAAEGTSRRKIWYRLTDRAIRSERHYYTTLNYIHYNPVKHGWVASPYDWAESSVHWYLNSFGRNWLREAWAEFPVRHFGRHWDEASS